MKVIIANEKEKVTGNMNKHYLSKTEEARSRKLRIIERKEPMINVININNIHFNSIAPKIINN